MPPILTMACCAKRASYRRSDGPGTLSRIGTRCLPGEPNSLQAGPAERFDIASGRCGLRSRAGRQECEIEISLALTGRNRCGTRDRRGHDGRAQCGCSGDEDDGLARHRRLLREAPLFRLRGRENGSHLRRRRAAKAARRRRSGSEVRGTRRADLDHSGCDNMHLPAADQVPVFRLGGGCGRLPYSRQCRPDEGPRWDRRTASEERPCAPDSLRPSSPRSPA